MLGTGFRLGPGGKGSNQAVAAARLGAKTCFIGRVGTDTFGQLARRTWEAEGIDTSWCVDDPGRGTGAAAVILHEDEGENAIVVDPGSGMHFDAADLERAAPRILASAVFATQLELEPGVVARALALAHRGGVTTILNPAPALPLPAGVYGACDWLTPNESEASLLLGRPVATPADARAAARALAARGARNVIVTLGAQGAVVCAEGVEEHVPAFDAGPVVETTGAGDAFTGALAVALSEGRGPAEATRFACRAAGISVTRPGTAASMPTRAEVDAATLTGRTS